MITKLIYLLGIGGGVGVVLLMGHKLGALASQIVVLVP